MRRRGQLLGHQTFALALYAFRGSSKGPKLPLPGSTDLLRLVSAASSTPLCALISPSSSPARETPYQLLVGHAAQRVGEPSSSTHLLVKLCRSGISHDPP